MNESHVLDPRASLRPLLEAPGRAEGMELPRPRAEVHRGRPRSATRPSDGMAPDGYWGKGGWVLLLRIADARSNCRVILPDKKDTLPHEEILRDTIGDILRVPALGHVIAP